MILFFIFYLFSFEPSPFSGIPLQLFNPLLIPYIYDDSINDFSPNYFYKNLNIKFKEPDSQKVISRFLLLRSTLNTEQNTVSSFLPLFKGEVNSLFYLSLWKNKTTFDFSQHNYFLKLKFKKIPLTLLYSQFDSNPNSKKISVKDLSISLKILSLTFLYSKESGKYTKEKLNLSLQNLFKNLFYKFSYTHYNFLISHKRTLKDFEINFKVPYFFTEIHMGNESKEGERYLVDSGFDFKFLRFSFFIEKLLFPFPFDSLKDFLFYEKPMRKKGICLIFEIFDYKKGISSFNLNIRYFKAKSFILNHPFKKFPSLYSGNLIDIFSSDSVEFSKRLMFFVKYRLIKGEDLEFGNLCGGFKFFILRNEFKNYFIYLRSSFYSFNENYFWRVSLVGSFYSYLMMYFSYSYPVGGNYFYPEGYIPFPYYSMKVTVNVPD